MKLLGARLEAPDGALVAVADALPARGVVALYFGNAWGAPCVEYTPRLKETHAALRAAGKPFEVVLVSSDRDTESFAEHRAAAPWYAVPYADLARRFTLAEGFDVRGAPSVVLLDAASGEELRRDGREAVLDAGSYPWPPPTLEEVLGGAFVGGGVSQSVSTEELKSRRAVVALLFGAAWVEACQPFAEHLGALSERVREGGGDLVVVYVSADKDVEAFESARGAMQPGWHAVPFDEEARRQRLLKHFKVSALPSLVMLRYSPGGAEVINGAARPDVEHDATGARFPWRPRKVLELEEADGAIEDTPSVVCLMEEAPGRWEAAEAALEAVARRVLKGYDDDPDPPYRFFVAKTLGSTMSTRVRKACRLGPARVGVADLVLLDLEDRMTFFAADPEAEVTEALVQGLVDGRVDGTVQRLRVSTD